MLSGPRSENEQNRLKPWSAASLARPTVGAEKRLKTPKKENKLNRRWTQIYADRGSRRTGQVANSAIVRADRAKNIYRKSNFS